MRKLIMAALAAATIVPLGTAAAQSAGEVRRGQEEVQRDREDVRDSVRRGDHAQAREDRQEMREDRRELREDWRDYRENNRELYRAGTYRGPRGYRYREVGAGYTFRPYFYSSRYWVNNPTRYRLEPVGRNQRWVRYGNDVVLINIRNGRVLRVHRNFFW